MSRLTIGRMARLYGLHRSTLHEAVKKGRLSSVLDEAGSRVIELSEMIRLYGEPKSSPYSTLHKNKDVSPTPDYLGMSEILDEIKALRAEVLELREQLLRIEYKPSALNEKSPKTFGEILKLFEG